MISSPATPTVCLEQQSEKFQYDIIDAVTISKLIVFDKICNVAYHSAAKFTFPIKQPSNKATKAASGDVGNWRWNRILVAVATWL